MSIDAQVEAIGAAAERPDDPDVLEERAQLLCNLYVTAMLKHVPRGVPADQFVLIIAAVAAKLVNLMAADGCGQELADLVCGQIKRMVKR
jgi:hypothetical protein